MEIAQDTLSATSESYPNVFQKWLGVDPGEVGTDVNPDTLLDSWGVVLDSLFGPDSRFLDPGLGFFTAGPPPDDPATPWSETVVYSWTNLTPWHIFPSCEDIVVPLDTKCVKNEMDDAWDTLESAADGLDTVETQAAKAIANAEDAVSRAKESLATTEVTLEDLQAGSDPLELEAKERELALAKANLDEAQARLAELTNASDPVDVEAREKQVALAQANLEQVEDDLSKLTAGPDVLQLEAQRKQVALAQANLDEAEEELVELRGSVDLVEVALREAEVVSARLGLETALQRLEGVSLKASMTGFVSLVNVEAGQTVNMNTPVVEVVDPTIVEVDGIVDEIDVLFVQEGAQAAVTMDALPGGVLDGVVSVIASAAQNQQGVVSYPISIQVQVPEGVQLREGLSATASIVIREDNDVLLVPNQAIFGTFEQPLVRVKNQENIEERAVSLGNSDDFWTVVTLGLQEGDQVVIEAAEAGTDPFAQIRQRFQAGGGGGGAFGGGGSGGFGGRGQRQLR